MDWDFSNAPASTGIQAIHPYPAKFRPQIPRQLIELFHPGDGSAVIDPFCGAGTTLVEAIDRGLDAWGIDLNPIACLIARVKTTPFPFQMDRVAKGIVCQAQDKFSKRAVSVPAIPRVEYWFKPDIQLSLAALVAEINIVEAVAIREALQVDLSSIIVRVSNQESNTRYAAVEKDVSAEKVFKRFEKAAAAVSRGVASRSDSLCRHLGKATVLNRDLLSG